MITLQSCTVNEVRDENDNDTISEVFEFTGVNFNTQNNFSVNLVYPHQIYTSDMVLVYHLYEVSGGQDVWRLMPQTYYLDYGDELDYNFEFNTNFSKVFLGSNFNLNDLHASWSQDQVFRVVVIPGFFVNKTANPVNFNNYHTVIKRYNINDKNVKKIKL
jgi:hypothetical protein